MKIIGLLLLISSLTSNMAYSQTATNLSTTQMQTHRLTNWEKNLKIRYFGEFAGPNLERWDDNQYDQDGQRTRTPVSLWNNFNFLYGITGSTALQISPRFYTQFGDRNDLRENEDQHVIAPDDLQLGIVQQIYRNSWMNYAGRLSHKHPISTASKNDQIKSQLEYQNDFTFLPSNAVSILFWNTYRYYYYETEKAQNEERYRINFSTLFNYQFNDHWKSQFFHELDLQHRAPKEGAGQRAANYFEKYKHTLAFGVGYSPFKALTVMPFLKALDLNKKRITEDTTQVGVWLFGNLFN